MERIRESHSVGDSRLGLLFGHGKRQKSYGMEIATKPLVMASEIAGLEPLHGYIKQENRVIPVKFALVKKRSLQPEFIERKMTIPEPRPLPAMVADPSPKPLQAPVEPAPKRKIATAVPAVDLEPTRPLSREAAPEEAAQPKLRKSAFKKNERAVDQLLCMCITLVQETTMPANALVQTRIDSGVKAKAAAVLEELGMTVSDAVRILLTRTANEGALPFPLAANAAAHDAWFRAKVQEAIDDPRPAVANDQVKAHFAQRRASALKKADASQ